MRDLRTRQADEWIVFFFFLSGKKKFYAYITCLPFLLIKIPNVCRYQLLAMYLARLHSFKYRELIHVIKSDYAQGFPIYLDVMYSISKSMCILSYLSDVVSCSHTYSYKWESVSSIYRDTGIYVRRLLQGYGMYSFRWFLYRLATSPPPITLLTQF